MTTKLFNIFAYEHGKFIAPRPTFARYFLSETGCKLGNLHRVHKGRESYLRVHICSILTERVRELNFFFLELFYLWRDGWRGECFLGNPV